MYIGLHDIITEGSWEWTGVATSGQSSSVTTFWRNGEPNDSGGEDCAVIESWRSDPLKSWNDVQCTREIKWVCERTASTV
ncbi:hypothetical protein UPYG_G00043720 [Umbra pygmaea]|uniref:C-type lectin domain-containing protein n=1 Tax=Umbra pygmaea TaxID=75934 RepID=A0ABD0XSS8_UMBPY